MTMRSAPPALFTVVVLAIAAILSGCGASARLLPAGQANRIDDQLQNVADTTLAGDCPSALAALAEAQRSALTLPPTVDPRLRSRIREGLMGLQTSVPADCRKVAATPTTPALPTPTGPTGPTTPATTPSTTDTTPSTTTTTPTTPTTTPTTHTTPSTTAPVGGASPDATTPTPPPTP